MTDSKAFIAKRYARERRFRFYGAAALVLTITFLAVLILDLVIKGIPAFSESRLQLAIELDAGKVDAANPAAGDYEGLARETLRGLFPTVTARADKKKLTGLLSAGSADGLREMVTADPALTGTKVSAPLLLSDEADLYLKGHQTGAASIKGEGSLGLAADGEAYALTGALTSLRPGDIIRFKGAALRVTSLDGGTARAEALIAPQAPGPVAAGEWSVLRLDTPEESRSISDREIAFLEALKDDGMVSRAFASRFFTSGDSREPELAGLRGALIGSLLTVAAALILALPFGIAAAVYLEEFAGKNRLTGIIEVNINNLAAVPSIIFGLLGLAMFLNVFGLPRSAPLVGGLVLALLVLPTIIIASRAALKAVPPSIKEAALGVGASHHQAVFHHVLPLALPGIMTGTILGLARAFGETAPLLMIGMVAFIADIPGGFTDAATVLPVQVFLWSDLPEAAFQSKTAAAILVLLAVLFILNAVAIILRKRFERRW